MPDTSAPPIAGSVAPAITPSHVPDPSGDAEHWRDRWQIAVQGSRDGIWDWDLRTNAVYFSPQWKRICGFDDDELPNEFSTWTALVHPDDIDRTLAQVQAAIDGKLAVYEPEFRMRHKDGSYRWVVARGMVLRNDAGVPVRMAGSHSDISDRRRAHEAIERAFANQRVLTALLQVGLEDASLTEMLQRALATLASAPLLATSSRLSVYLREAPDDTLVRVAHRGDAASGDTGAGTVACSMKDQRACRCRRAMASGTMQFAPYVAPDECGESHGTLTGFYAIPLMSDGVAIGVLVVHLERDRARDAHDDEFLTAAASTLAGMIRRRRTEEELRSARDAAEAASRAKSDFLATMSHEIRTPMNGVMGMLSLLLDTPLGRDQREFAETSLASAQSLMSILNDILDLSKIEAGKIELEPVPFSPAPTLSELVEMFQASARAKGLTLSLRLDAGIPGRVHNDVTRIRQVVTNLVGNAIKFTTVGAVRVSLGPAGTLQAPALRVTVADTGIGIAADHLGQVFEKFTQGDTSTTRRFGGTGLGLAITQQLVHLLGGEVEVESTLGVGTTFRVTIPVVVLDWREAQAGVSEERRELRARSLTPSTAALVQPPREVLLVEDNEVNALVALHLLQRAGHHVTHARNGREAVEACRAASFDVILMDCMMPELDGFEATAQIRAMEATGGRRTRIVAMTANAFAQDRERCVSAGMDDYLAKPLDQEAIGRLFQLLDAPNPLGARA